jgi:thiamine biosynthesis lipoprotein
MGTVVSFDVREADPGCDVDAALDRAMAWLHEVDARFSPYRPDSEISRIADRRLHRPAAHPDTRTVLAMCDAIRSDSDGVFDAWRWAADGRLDPSGLVKGWSVQRASDDLINAGLRAFAINAGGDVVVVGGGRLARPWRIGIRHPDRADAVAAVLDLADGAVATSGSYERGSHIRDPRRLTSPASAPEPLRSLTVVGPSLTWADAYATTAFVMGRRGLGWVADHAGYDVVAITADDRILRTVGRDAPKVA